jgi:hypothetical protein
VTTSSHIQSNKFTIGEKYKADAMINNCKTRRSIKSLPKSMLQPTLLRMIEPEDVILAEDHPRASLQDDSLLHFPAIDITECSFFGSHGDDAFMVLKDTVFTENM